MDTMKLKALRNSKGWSMSEVAQHLGISKHTVSSWESGRLRIAAKWWPELEGLADQDSRVVGVEFRRQYAVMSSAFMKMAPEHREMALVGLEKIISTLPLDTNKQLL